MSRRAIRSIVAFVLCMGLLPAAADDFSDVAIFATNSIALKNDVTVTGDVVVNNISPGPTLGPPSDFELSVDKKSSVFGDLTANRIKVFQQATINGDVFRNVLDNSGTINGTVFAFPGAPVFAAPPPFQPGTLSGGEQNVSVASGQTVVLAAGEYGDITVEAGGTLNFSGGVYHIRSIDAVGDNAVISFSSTTELRIVKKFRTRKNAVIGPAVGAGIDASDIVLYVGGINGSDGALNSTPEAARVGSGSIVNANFYAPNGTFRAETNVIATGAFLGRDVRIDSRATVNRDSFFVNKEPTLNAIANAAILEDDEVQVVSLSGISAGGPGCLTPPNVCETQNLTVTATSSDPGLIPNPTVNYTSPNTTGSLSYAPAPDQHGSAVITVKVMDDGGTANGGDDTIERTFIVTVTPVPDAPRAADDGPFVVAEGGSVAGNVLTNDVEPDGQPLTVTSNSPASFGFVTLNAAGDFTYTHGGSESTGDSFTYQVCDNEVPPKCDSADVTFTITPVNDAPVALPQTVVTDGTTNPVSITLTGTDAEGGPLAFSITSGPTQGTLSAVTNVPPFAATVTYTPNSANDLEDSFTFEVEDPQLATDTAVVSINPDDPTADPPAPTNAVIAKDQSVEVVKDAPLDLVLVAFPDVADPGAVGDLVFSIVSGPASGTLNPVPPSPFVPVVGNVRSATTTYTPNAGFTGNDSFVFRACGDLNFNSNTTDPGECDDATVSLAVGVFNPPPPPVAPVAQNLDVTTVESKPAKIELFEGESIDCTVIPVPQECEPRPASDSAKARGTLANTFADTAAGEKTGPVGGFNHPDPPTLDEGAWSLFYCADETSDCDSSFTFVAPSAGACIRVTDVLQKGDRFTVFDNGNAIGTTPAVTAVAGSETNPDLAFADPTYSSGAFEVGVGTHPITIRADLDSPGAAPAHAFARVDSGPCKADLIVSSLTHDPASPDAENPITFTAVVKNIGNNTAGESELCLRIVGVEDCAMETSFPVPSLEPGASAQVVRVETLSNGQYQNEARADWLNEVVELDENNNKAFDTYVVGDPRVVATITLSAGFIGTLLDSSGSTIPIGQTTLANTTVTYVPPAGVTVTTSFSYQLFSQVTGLSSAVAEVNVAVVALIDLCAQVGRTGTFPNCVEGQ